CRSAPRQLVQSPFGSLFMPKGYNPVVDCGDDPPIDVSNDEAVGRAEETAGESDPVSGKILIQKLEMTANVGSAFKHQNIGGEKNACGDEYSKGQAEHIPAQSNYFLNERLFVDWRQGTLFPRWIGLG